MALRRARRRRMRLVGGCDKGFFLGTYYLALSVVVHVIWGWIWVFFIFVSSGIYFRGDDGSLGGDGGEKWSVGC